LNEEQQKIIERSEKRNEELIQSSKTKQQIIDGQAKLIDELTNLSKEQKKSSKEKVLTNVLIITAVAAVGFAGGCYAGIKIGR
jgi:dsDNA-specific endonuclease/ATPase MutS2